MKKKITFVCLLIFVPIVVMGQGNTPAIQELHAGARSFQDGKFQEAQQHFEKARELDSNYKYTQLLVAWALYEQVRPGVESPANLALARRTIAAFKDYLVIDPSSELAFNFIAALYGDLREDELQRVWLLDRAKRETAPKKQRAECYTVVASKAWSCSFFQAKKNTATKQCVSDGLQLIEKGLALDPDSSLAWLYKGELLSEMAKVSASLQEKAHYEKLAADAKRRSRALKAQQPTEASGTHRRITGDEQLDEVLDNDFSLTYLTVPVPLPSEPHH